MDLREFLLVWQHFMERTALWQSSFDTVYAICCGLWLILGTLTVVYTGINTARARLDLELARTLYATTVLLGLGGAMLGFHTSLIACAALVGSCITYLMFVRLTDRAQCQLISTQNLRYLYSGFSVIAANSVCTTILIVS